MSEEEDLDEHVTSPVLSARSLRAKPPIGARSQQQARRRVEERIRLQQLKEEAALAACSFAPRTLSAPRRRDFSEFLDESQRGERAKAERLQRERIAAELKQTEEDASHPFRPQIGPLPPGMKPQKPVHLRDHSSPRNLSEDFQYNFTPAISEASRQLLRTQPVDSLLYKDAMRRLSERRHQLPLSPPPIHKADKSLRRLFREEFDKACQDLPQCLQFTELQTLLQRLYFADEQLAKDLWTWLSCGERLSLPLLQQALCGVLGIAKPSARTGAPMSHGRLDGDRLYLTRKEIAKLHRSYAAQCQMRHGLKRNKAAASPPPRLKRSCSADTCKEDSQSVCLRLAGEARKLQEKLESQRREQVQKDLEECSFHPKLHSPSRSRGDLTERLYSENARRIERLKKKQAEKENAAEQFPFKPTLSPRLVADAPSPKGADVAADRLRRGFDQRVLADRMQQQGFPYSPSRPLATIRVNVRPGESGLIEVLPHSDLQQLVHDFAAAHCLPTQQEDRLLALVRKQLREH